MNTLIYLKTLLASECWLSASGCDVMDYGGPNKRLFRESSRIASAEVLGYRQQTPKVLLEADTQSDNVHESGDELTGYKYIASPSSKRSPTRPDRETHWTPVRPCISGQAAQGNSVSVFPARAASSPSWPGERIVQCPRPSPFLCRYRDTGRSRACFEAGPPGLAC